MRISKTDKAYQFANGVFFVVVCLTMMSPLIHLAALSFSGEKFINSRSVVFWPRGFNWTAYRYIMHQTRLWRSLLISVYITAVGTLVTLGFTSTIAYALSRPYMPARKLVLKAIIVTFIFPVPLIPYFLVVRSLGLYDTLWALMIPSGLGAFHVIIMKTFFQGISQELFDAATIDGCSEFGVFLRITLPLSTAVIATIGLFRAVNIWNTYFQALIFIRSKDLRPVQVLLRGLVIEEELDATAAIDPLLENYTPEQMKAAIILFATIPILIVYPFIQKYFVKGAMLGSLKG
jgi:ABC-type glycerol-3-phosphate transport system permease component